MIQTVFHWLQAVPGLENLKAEALDPRPGSAGLFCKGEEILSRSEDILGETRLRKRLSFTLQLHRADASGPETFLNLTRQLRDTAPVLGQQQTLRITQGQTVKDGGLGIARSSGQIIFEFTEDA